MCLRSSKYDHAQGASSTPALSPPLFRILSLLRCVMTHPCNQTLYWSDRPTSSKMTQTETWPFSAGTHFLGQALDLQKGSGSVLGWGPGTHGESFEVKQRPWAPGTSCSPIRISKPRREAGAVSRQLSWLQTVWVVREQGTQDLTWYVLSKLSYMNLVIRDVFPTVKQEERVQPWHLSYFPLNTFHVKKTDLTNQTSPEGKMRCGNRSTNKRQTRERDPEQGG